MRLLQTFGIVSTSLGTSPFLFLLPFNRRLITQLTAHLALATNLATFAPISNGPSYSVGIPPSSSISQSSKGGIYLSLSAPSSFQWVGLGIGSSMAGSTIFVMYADGTGNVTISGRDGGQGHVEPQLDSTLMTGVTLLAGSGVINNTMVANVHCTLPHKCSEREED
jgi:hypothetical protein